ncbi:MAG: DUF3553 domain-containing protein [Deltaproteobacteria bacterium]|nr:DUF3553 domain-containing protein [Deltaproteobacteria bacterium]
MIRRRLYLNLGDTVYHQQYRIWGLGRVIEVKTSILEGGPALVRISFQDGRERTFFNDLDQEGCCYYMGIRFYEEECRRARSSRRRRASRG